jgi:hypothetical protein
MTTATASAAAASAAPLHSLPREEMPFSKRIQAIALLALSAVASFYALPFEGAIAVTAIVLTTIAFNLCGSEPTQQPTRPPHFFQDISPRPGGIAPAGHARGRFQGGS